MRSWLRLALLLVAGGPLAASAASSITYVGAGTLRNTTGNGTTGLPTGYAAKDLCLVISESIDSQTHSLTSPSGWTNLIQANHSSNLNHVSVFYRFMASGSETAPTVSRTTSTARIVSRVICYRGVDNAINPTAGTVQENTTTAGGTLATATPAVTTSVNNSLVLHVAGISNVTNATAAVSSPTGINGTTYSFGFSAGGTSTTRNGLWAYSALKTPAGSSGTSNITTTQADKVMSAHIYLTPDTNGSATLTQQVGTGYLTTSEVAPTLVAGTPVTGTNATGTTVAATVPASTWLAGDVIVAVQANGDNTTTANAMGAAGGVLTFTSRVSAANGTSGDCAIWTAVAGADQGGSSVAITATDSDGSGSSRSLAVYVLRGASTSGPWTNVVSTTTGSGTVFSLTGTGAASSFWPAGFMGRTSATTATPNADSTEVVDYNGGGNTVWQGYNNKNQTSQTIGGTWAGTQAYVGCMMEIPGTAGGVSFGGGGGTLAQQVGTGTIASISSSGGGGGGGDASATLTATGATGTPVALAAGGGGALAAQNSTGTLAALTAGGGGGLASQVGTGTVVASVAGGGGLLTQRAGTGFLASLSAAGGAGATLAQSTSTGALAATYAGGGGAPAVQVGTGTVYSVSASGGAGGDGTATLAQVVATGTYMALSSAGAAVSTLAARAGEGALNAIVGGGGGLLAALAGEGVIAALSATGGGGDGSATLTQVGTGGVGTCAPTSGTLRGGGTQRGGR